MIKDNGVPKSDLKYKYYIRFNLSIRNVINKKGHAYGADTLNIKTRTLVKNASLINPDFNDAYVMKLLKKSSMLFVKS